MDNIDYGKRLKLFRKSANLEPKVLAELADMDVTTIYKLEKNITKPSFDSLERMCSVMGITMADFFSQERNIDLPAHVKSILEDTDLLNALIEVKNRPEMIELLKEAMSASQQTITITTVIIKALKEKLQNQKV